MTTSTPTTARPHSRLWLKLAISAILLVSTPLAGWWYLSWSEEREFQALLAETDRLDPGWRLEEILAARPALPDERNSAKQAQKAWNALTGGINSGRELDVQFTRLPPNVPLSASLTDALRKLLAREAAARAAALLLMDMPESRFVWPADADGANYPSDGLLKLLALSRLMEFDVVLAAEERNPTQAAASLRAGINLGRSVGAEPTLMGQLVAVACVVRCVTALERALAQLELSAAELTAIQELLEREIDAPRMVWALRGERAGLLEFLQQMDCGPKQRAGGGLTQWQLSALRGSRGKYAWLADWAPWTMPINRTGLLRAMNELVEAAKLPVEKQFDETKRLQAALNNHDAFVQQIVGYHVSSLSDHIGDRVRLRCAIPALAAERYRKQRGDWPASLDTLVKAGLLKAVPLDPYDGKALRFRHLDDGVVIYSVGVDRVDNGGNSDHQNPKTPVSDDIGFRLWDKGARGKAAKLPGHDADS